MSYKKTFLFLISKYSLFATRMRKGVSIFFYAKTEMPFYKCSSDISLPPFFGGVYHKIRKVVFDSDLR